jgi:ABC-2 type transport system permease protein
MKLLTITERELRILFNEKTVFVHLFRTTTFVFIFGLTIGKLIGSIKFGVHEISYLVYLLQGNIIASIFLSSLVAGFHTLLEKTTGMDEELKLLPIHWRSILWGRVIAYLLLNLMTAILLLAILSVLDRNINLLTLLTSIVIVLFVSISFVSFGIAVGGKCKSAAQFSSIANLVEFPLMFASTLFIPLEIMPNALKIFALLNPVTHAINNLRFAYYDSYNIDFFYSFIYLLYFTILMGWISTSLYTKHKE